MVVGKGSEAFACDADRNLTSDGRWKYWCDGENRLVQVESRSDVPSLARRKVEWQYDALGRRIRQTTSIWLVQSNLWVVTEDLEFVRDPLLFGRHVVDLNASNNVLIRSYVWGLDLSGRMDGAGGVGGLLWVTLHTASGPVGGPHFAGYDGNGNVVALVSATAGTETARYEYGPFAEPLRVTGPAAAQNPFRFSTKRTDPTTDLVLYEYRAYSPALGRWLSRDPIGERGGKNLCVLVGNDPRNHVDFLGFYSCRRLGKISWGYSANIATGIYVGWDASGEVEKCGCCYTATIDLGVEVGIGVKFRRQASATVKIPEIGQVGVYFGIDAVFSLAQQRTHASATITWCPGEVSGGGKVYLVDLDLGPSMGISVFGGGQVGRRIKLNVSANVSPSIVANVKGGVEVVPTEVSVEVYAIGSATFDFRLNAGFTLSWQIGSWTSPDWLDLGEFNWSLFGGPVGFQERRLGRIVSLP